MSGGKEKIVLRYQFLSLKYRFVSMPLRMALIAAFVGWRVYGAISGEVRGCGCALAAA